MRVLRVSLCIAALALLAIPQARPRVFISASAGQRSGFTAELLHRCPGATVVTLATAHAEFTVALVDTGAGLLWHPYRWSLANDQGDVLAAGRDRTMRGVAKDVCRALHRLPELRATGS